MSIAKPGFSWSRVKEVKTLENTPTDMWLAKAQIQAFEKACYKGFECTQIITVSGLHIPSSLNINELLKQLN